MTEGSMSDCDDSIATSIDSKDHTIPGALTSQNEQLPPLSHNSSERDESDLEDGTQKQTINDPKGPMVFTPANNQVATSLSDDTAEIVSSPFLHHQEDVGNTSALNQVSLLSDNSDTSAATGINSFHTEPIEESAIQEVENFTASASLSRSTLNSSRQLDDGSIPMTEQEAEESEQQSQPRRATRSTKPLIESPASTDNESELNYGEDPTGDEEADEEDEQEEDEETVVKDMLDTLIGRVEGRWSIVDEGKSFDFPREGMCYVPLQLNVPAKYKGEADEIRKVLWPCWLIAKQKKKHVSQQVVLTDISSSDNNAAASKLEQPDGSLSIDTAVNGKVEPVDGQKEEGEALVFDQPRVVTRKNSEGNLDELRTVCCYGDGRFLQIEESLIIPFDESNAKTVSAKNKASKGGVLWREATKQADARYGCPEEFITMISQNIEHCAAPVLLGRLWSTEQTRDRTKRLPRGSTISVKWNAGDWWPARVVYAREDGKGIEIEYEDGEATREEMKWPEEDVYVLDDVKQAIDYDSDDAEILEEGHACNFDATKKPVLVDFDEKLLAYVNSDTSADYEPTVDTFPKLGDKKIKTLKKRNSGGGREVNEAGGPGSPKKAKNNSSELAGSVSTIKKHMPIAPKEKSSEQLAMEAKASADAIRKSVRLKLQSVLVFNTSEEKRALKEVTDGQSTGVSQNDSNSTILDAASLAGAVEREIFACSRSADKVECGSAMLVGSAYKRKLRQLAFNLRKNLNLRARVCMNKISPPELVKMDAEALANDDIQKQRAIAREKALYNRQKMSSLNDETKKIKFLDDDGNVLTEVGGKSLVAKEAESAGGSSSSENASTRNRPRGVGKMRKPTHFSALPQPSNRLSQLLKDISRPDSDVSTDTCDSKRDEKSSTSFDSLTALTAMGDVSDNEGENNDSLHNPYESDTSGALEAPACLDMLKSNEILSSNKTTPVPPQQVSTPRTPRDTQGSHFPPSQQYQQQQQLQNNQQPQQPPPPNVKLPAGWIPRYSGRKGKWYYVEENTGESRWDPPPLPRAGMALSLVGKPSTPRNPTTAPALPTRVVRFADEPITTPVVNSNVLPRRHSVIPTQNGNAITSEAIRVKEFEARISTMEVLIMKGDVEGIRSMVCQDEKVLVTLLERNDTLLEAVEKLLSSVACNSAVAAAMTSNNAQKPMSSVSAEGRFQKNDYVVDKQNERISGDSRGGIKNDGNRQTSRTGRKGGRRGTSKWGNSNTTPITPFVGKPTEIPTPSSYHQQNQLNSRDTYSGSDHKHQSDTSTSIHQTSDRFKSDRWNNPDTPKQNKEARGVEMETSWKQQHGQSDNNQSQKQAVSHYSVAPNPTNRNANKGKGSDVVGNNSTWNQRNSEGRGRGGDAVNTTWNQQNSQDRGGTVDNNVWNQQNSLGKGRGRDRGGDTVDNSAWNQQNSQSRGGDVVDNNVWNRQNSQSRGGDVVDNNVWNRQNSQSRGGDVVDNNVWNRQNSQSRGGDVVDNNVWNRQNSEGRGRGGDGINSKDNAWNVSSSSISPPNVSGKQWNQNTQDWSHSGGSSRYVTDTADTHEMKRKHTEPTGGGNWNTSPQGLSKRQQFDSSSRSTSKVVSGGDATSWRNSSTRNGGSDDGSITSRDSRGNYGNEDWSRDGGGFASSRSNRENAHVTQGERQGSRFGPGGSRNSGEYNKTGDGRRGGGGGGGGGGGVEWSNNDRQRTNHAESVPGIAASNHNPNNGSPWAYDLQVAMRNNDVDAVKRVLAQQPSILTDLATGKGLKLHPAEQRANEQILVSLEQMLDKAASTRKQPPSVFPPQVPHPSVTQSQGKYASASGSSQPYPPPSIPFPPNYPTASEQTTGSSAQYNQSHQQSYSGSIPLPPPLPTMGNGFAGNGMGGGKGTFHGKGMSGVNTTATNHQMRSSSQSTHFPSQQQAYPYQDDFNNTQQQVSSSMNNGYNSGGKGSIGGGGGGGGGGKGGSGGIQSQVHYGEYTGYQRSDPQVAKTDWSSGNNYSHQMPGKGKGKGKGGWQSSSRSHRS